MPSARRRSFNLQSRSSPCSSNSGTIPLPCNPTRRRKQLLPLSRSQLSSPLLHQLVRPPPAPPLQTLLTRAELEAPPSLNRVKGTTTSHSPLSGIKPLHSPSTQRAPLPSPTKEGKRRESSASPPPYAASPAPGSTNGSGSATPVPSSGVRLDSLAEFGVPRMTTGPCNPSVQVRPSPLSTAARADVRCAGQARQFPPSGPDARTPFQRLPLLFQSVPEP